MAAGIYGLPWQSILASFCFLQVATAFITQPEFSANLYGGKWYTIGIVLDKETTVTNTKSHQLTIETVPTNQLVITVQKPEEDCAKEQFEVSRGKKAGQYTRLSGDQKISITIVETDYDSFSILGTESRLVRALHLYSRHPEVSDDVKEKFKNYAKCTNFPVDRIIYLTKPDTWC